MVPGEITQNDLEHYTFEAYFDFYFEELGGFEMIITFNTPIEIEAILEVTGENLIRFYAVNKRIKYVNEDINS